LTKKCMHCGKNIYGCPADLKRRKYCSRECGIKAKCGTYIDWEPLFKGLSEKIGVRFESMKPFIQKIYPGMYRNRQLIADDLGVSLGALNRFFDREGITR